MVEEILQGTKSFIADAYKTPHWILATILFGSAVTFISSYQGANPQEWALLEYSNNELELQERDNERVCNLRGHILTGLQDFRNLLGQLMSVMSLIEQDVKESGSTSRGKEIDALHEQATKVSKSLRILKATVKGFQFRTPAYNDEARLEEEFLDSHIKWSELVEEFCHAYLSGDQNFTQNIKQLAERAVAQNEESNTLSLKNENIEIQCESARKLNLVEKEKLSQQKWNYRIKGVGYYLALAISTLYIGAVLLGIVKSASGKKEISRAPKRKTKPKRKRNR